MKKFTFNYPFSDGAYSISPINKGWISWKIEDPPETISTEALELATKVIDKIRESSKGRRPSDS